MNKVFTAGYQGRTPEQLKQAAEALDAIVCDIRFARCSKIPGWNEWQLEALLKDRYVTVFEWGNVNYKSGPIKLNNPAAGLFKVLKLLEAHAVILLCGCREYSECHRRMCAELFHERGAPTRELDWPESESIRRPKQESLF